MGVNEPEFSIEGIKDHVISVHLTDESGTIDDVAEICVHYDNENLEVPNELNIALGYKEIGIFPMGIYTVNEVTIQGPPKSLFIIFSEAKQRKQERPFAG